MASSVTSPEISSKISSMNMPDIIPSPLGGEGEGEVGYFG